MANLIKKPTRPLRNFVVAVDGYTDEIFAGASAAAARYRAFLAFTEFGPRLSFREWLDRAHVTPSSCGRAP